ncbi:MAG TPA: YbhB/YbcL family Raf kinase inhibitor-like protein [Terriglobales bacterium]
MNRLVILLASICLANAAVAQHGGSMKFESSAFSNGEPIPQKFTCQGANVSPALSWSGAPVNTKSFLLIVNDPDAPVGDWTHWIFSNIPPAVHALPENVEKTEVVLGGYQVMNDFKETGYGGPCPPPGKPHRYFFRLYALDTSLTLKPGSTRQSVERTIKGHVLAQAELMGTYQRK